MLNVINVLKEFTSILPQFEKANIRYAVIGGLAVNIYTQVRATKDIDFLIAAEDLDAACQILQKLGYLRKENTLPFKKSGLELQRLLKAVDNDFMVVDLLIAVSNEMANILQNSIEVDFSFGKLKVILKEDLIRMKTLANRPQDIADIEKLKEDET